MDNKLEKVFDQIIFTDSGKRETVSTYGSLAKQFDLPKSKVKRLFWRYWNDVAAPQMMLWAWKDGYPEKEAKREIAEIKNTITKQLEGDETNGN